MKQSATVRIKGANWEALASETSSDWKSATLPTLTKQLLTKNRMAGNRAKSMLLDLAVRHFHGLQLTSTEAKRLANALWRCLKGEAVDVGPVGSTGGMYSFRRRVNAISIRAGEGRMRLPLDAARALIESLKGAVRPAILAKPG